MDFSLDDLKLAFSLHVVDQILTADDEVTASEEMFLKERFPLSMLQEQGLVDADGERTDRYHEAAMAALDSLPTALDYVAKCALLGVFVDATVADDDFALEEGNALVDAARLLDMDDREIERFLSSRSEVNADLASIDAAGD